MSSDFEGPQVQTPDHRVMLAHFLHQIEARHAATPHHTPVMLHYDSTTGALVEYSWPCDPTTEERFPPSDLEAARRTHRFKAPCCLCAYTDSGTTYTETRIGLVEALTRDPLRNQSVLHGEYAAVCARQRCGYFLCLERFYTLPNLKVQICRRRSKPLPAQTLVLISDVEKSFREGDGLFQVMTDVSIRGHKRDLQELDPHDAIQQLASVFEELVRGVTEQRFYSLFVQCIFCKQVMFREFFAAYHVCERNSRRYRPYRRSAGCRRRTFSVVTAMAADLPEACPSSALRADFDNEDRVESDAEGDTEPEDAVDLPVVDRYAGYPGLGSDDNFELPSITELMRQSGTRQDV